MSELALAPAFLAALSDGARSELAGRAQLERTLVGHAREAREAWPQLGFDAVRFVTYVARRLPAEGRAWQTLETLHAADLALALGCTLGDRAALAAFEAEAGPAMDAALGAMRLPPHQVDEVKQEVRRKLLVADGAVPKIAEYSGRAPLKSWLQTVAVRTAVSALRRHKDVSISDDALMALPAGADGPELAAIKERYRPEAKRALEDAIATLTSRQRSLLRYHFIDGLSIDQVGDVFAVHRATAARWLVAAREELGKQFEQNIKKRLKLSKSEARQMVALVQSQMHLSMQRLLS